MFYATIATKAPDAYDYRQSHTGAIVGRDGDTFSLSRNDGTVVDVKGEHRIVTVREFEKFSDCKFATEYQAERYASGLYSTVILGYYSHEDGKLTDAGHPIDPEDHRKAQEFLRNY